MLKKPVWNTIETTLFYYSDNMATAHVWSPLPLYVPPGLKNVKLFSSNEAKFGNAEPAEPRGYGD